MKCSKKTTRFRINFAQDQGYIAYAFGKSIEKEEKAEENCQWGQQKRTSEKPGTHKDTQKKTLWKWHPRGLGFFLSQLFSSCYLGPDKPAVVFLKNSFGCLELSWKISAEVWEGVRVCFFLPGSSEQVWGWGSSAWRVTKGSLLESPFSPRNNCIMFRQSVKVGQEPGTVTTGTDREWATWPRSWTSHHNSVALLSFP